MNHYYITDYHPFDFTICTAQSKQFAAAQVHYCNYLINLPIMLDAEAYELAPYFFFCLLR